MFGLGVPEVVFILVLALVIFGPKKLPEVGRVIGRGLSEFRRASTELQRTVNTELSIDEPAPPRTRLRAAEPEEPEPGPKVVPVASVESHPRGTSSE